MTTYLELTSTGKGHEYRSPLAFPPLNFERSVTKPLPPILRNNNETTNIFLTTTGTAHDYKPHDLVLNNIEHKKAPGHWKVHYTADTISKIEERPQREPLTMGNQESEMKSEYTGKPVMSLDTSSATDRQPPVYKHHFTNGPLKTIQPSTDSFLLVKGKKYPVQHKGVFDYHGEMYQSTTQKDHRLFSKEELDDYPKKTYATFWECENYPKSWGHGSSENPLPADLVQRELGPMRDTLLFKSATIIPRIPKRLEPVPNTGMCSEVMANYKDITSEDREQLFQCPVPQPPIVNQQFPSTVDEPFDYAIPKMYDTEYDTIGSGKLVTV